MLEAIEKLLILQDRDRKITRLRAELANLAPERAALQSKTAASLSALDTARQRTKQIEIDRKKLELEVEAKKQAIERYSLQQFQTKKNDEYRALAHEIEMAREAIRKIEDQELELMEQAEAAQKQAAASTRVADEARKSSEKLLADLAQREETLKKELAQLESDRDQLAGWRLRSGAAYRLCPRRKCRGRPRSSDAAAGIHRPALCHWRQWYAVPGHSRAW